MPGENRDRWSSHLGWRPGRAFYAWHIPFADSSEIAALQASYDGVIGKLTGFVPVSPLWLHLTLQGVGFADRVPNTDLDEIVAATRLRVRGLGNVRVIAGPAVLDLETLQLPVRPIKKLRHLRDLTRLAVADVWGSDAVPRLPEFDPHITLAYRGRRAATDAVAADVLPHPGNSAALSITKLALARLTRTHAAYRWIPYVTISLDEPAAHAEEP